MKDILLKIMAPPVPERIAATVLRRLDPGRYELRDDLGRIFPANAEAVFTPGAYVIVESGRIIARAGKPPTIRTYEV